MEELNEAMANIVLIDEFYSYELMEKYHEGTNYTNAFLTKEQKNYVNSGALSGIAGDLFQKVAVIQDSATQQTYIEKYYPELEIIYVSNTLSLTISIQQVWRIIEMFTWQPL